MPVFDNSQTMMAGSSAQSTGSDIGTYTGKSCLFSGSDEFLNKTWGTTETDADKFTISMWIKRNNTDSGSTQYWLVGAQTGAERTVGRVHLPRVRSLTIRQCYSQTET